MPNTANPSTGTTLFHFPYGFYAQVRFMVSDMSQGFFPAICFLFDDYNTSGAGNPTAYPIGGSDINLFEGGQDGCASGTPVNDCVEANYGSANPDIGKSDQTFYNVGYDITQQFVTVGVELVPGSHVSIYYNGHLMNNYTNAQAIAATGQGIGWNPSYNLQITPQNINTFCGAPCSSAQ